MIPSALRNIELKVHYPDLAVVPERLRGLTFIDDGARTQIDTYFQAPRGRLKLREEDGRPAILIAYARPTEAGYRTSNYRLIPISDPAALKAGLEETVGLRGIVKKRRQVFLWENVRIHLDEVVGLGNFIEFEAVLSSDADEAISNKRLDELCRRLGIDSSKTIAGSYSDLLGI